MFAVLKVDLWERSVKNKFNEYLGKPVLKIEERQPENGKSYCEITIKPHKGDIPWAEIEKMSGHLKNYFLLPFSVSLPKNTAIREFTPKVFPEKMLFNSVVNYIENQNISPNDISVTVADEKGIYTDEIFKLAFLVSSLKVVTENMSYNRIKEKLMKDYGLSLIVTNSFDSGTLKSDFLIAPKGENIPLCYKGTAFSLSKHKLPKGKVLTGEGITLPENIEKLWDKNINKLLFASALYEKCALNSIENLCFDYLCY